MRIHGAVPPMRFRRVPLIKTPCWVLPLSTLLRLIPMTLPSMTVCEALVASSMPSPVKRMMTRPRTTPLLPEILRPSPAPALTPSSTIFNTASKPFASVFVAAPGCV